MSLPKPYYDHAGITIYHGDCREILPHLPKVDLVLTDPPWNLNYFKDDKKEWGEYARWLDGIKNQCIDKSDVVWIFQSQKAIPYVAHLFKEWRMFAGLKTFSQVIKHRIPNMFDVAFFNSSKGYLGNGRNWHLGKTHKVWENNSLSHPTSRPLDTIKFIISMYSSKTILDPFVGSGTTLRAAKDLNRKAIGIEIEEKYCEVAAKRLSQEVLEFG